VPKHQRHFNGFDDKILSMYARGMSVRDIRAHLEEIYGVSVDADLISRVTDSVVDELKAWQHRPLDALYLVVYLDALVVKIRDKGAVQNKAVYLAVGVGMDGTKDVLGMWIQQTEGAKFWMSILTEIRNRGVQDILILCADGLTGLPDAVGAVFPEAVFQTCIVHMVRSSVRYVGFKERKAVCADLGACTPPRRAVQPSSRSRNLIGAGASSTPRSLQDGGNAGRRLSPSWTSRRRFAAPSTRRMPLKRSTASFGKS